jgi:Holliday junction resolvasome RuvABC endonuclease subunit
VLGLDPAIKNYGFAMLEIREDLTAWRIIDCGLLLYPLNEMTFNLKEGIEKYTFEMKRMIRMWRPRDVVVERYQNRSRIGASQNEKVNIMIGIAALMADQADSEIHAYTASQWKNKVNAKTDLDEIYKHTRNTMRKFCKRNDIPKKKTDWLLNQVAHSVDATIMALFIGSGRAGINPFTFINTTIADKVVNALTRGLGE